MAEKPYRTWFGKLNSVRDRMRLRQQISLATAGLCFLSIMVAAIVASTIARQAAIEETRQDLVLIGQSMAQTLDQDMFNRFREVRNIAELELLRPVWKRDPAAIRDVLDQLQQSLPVYAWIGFAAPDGTVIASTQTMLEGQSVAERPWFINGLTGPTAEDVHKAKLLDKLLRTSEDDAPFRFVDVAMPVRDEYGNAAGVLGAHMSWSWAQQTQQRFLERNFAKKHLEIFILSEDNQVLVGEPLLAIEEQDIGTGVFPFDVDASNMLTAMVPTQGFSAYQGLGWKVALRQPMQVVTARADQMVLMIVVIGSLIALFAALISWFVSRNLSNPLLQLVKAMDQIGRSADERAVPRQSGSREVLQLSVAIRSLLRRLGVVEAKEKTAVGQLEKVHNKYRKRIQSSEERNRQLGADLRHLKSLAEQDPLSGLMNRRAFQPFADDAWATFVRHRRVFSVLMFDADHFKSVNDTHGHQTGDEVIRAIGRIIAEEIRTTDKAARFGGEEFLLLLRENDAKGAFVLAERIRLRIASEAFQSDKGACNVTVSIGLAEVTVSDRDIEDTIARADHALYLAKSTGRNRVSVDMPVHQSKTA
ncbi:MAG: sensor domain-containing diguanylate cyclase [Labrenzia sp.]